MQEIKSMLLSVVIFFHIFVSGHSELMEHSGMFENLQKSCIISSTEHTREATSKHLLKLFNVSLAKEVAEATVHFTQVDLSTFVWPNGEKIQFLNGEQDIPLSSKEVFIIPRQKEDRTCLLKPSVKVYPNAHLPSSSAVDNLESLLEFINSVCNLYKHPNGYLSVDGIHRNEILETLFHVNSVSQVTMRNITSSETRCSPSQLEEMLANCDDSVISEQCDRHEVFDRRKSCARNDIPDSKTIKYSNYVKDHSSIKSIPRIPSSPVMANCDVIDHIPSKEEFFHKYLKISKPVIFRNSVESWPAFHKWSNQYLQEQYGTTMVHIKLTPGGEYEGVESTELWEDYKHFKIPPKVKKQLQFPDLVVVRPAVLNINFTDFLAIVESVANGSQRNISAYLEYSSIPQYFPELEADVSEFRFISDLLRREHLNLWLSDGNTLGKLHFDPFDNLLCQISGTKEVIMFEPHNNSRLYEAHIPEAILSYDKERKQFRRKTLLDSTSMVMSPVDLRNPDYERFPRFADASPLKCTIKEGDVLFMPSYWWHEVQSYPNKSAGRNLAVNYWYEPFLQKDIPCAECALDINPAYRHLL